MLKLEDGEVLYKKESISNKFFFLMSGKVNFGQFNDAEKLTTKISLPQFFGFCEDL